MPSSAQDIMRFGNFYRTALRGDATQEALSILRPDEVSFIESLHVGSDAETAYRHLLEDDINEFFEVRQHIMALLQVWDAIIDEKNRHDAGGRPRVTSLFMKAFLVCMELIPGRVNLGALGLESLDSGLSPLGLSPPRNQEEAIDEPPVEVALEGLQPAQSNNSSNDLFCTSSDDDDTSSIFTDISDFQFDLDYDLAQAYGDGLDIDSGSFGNLTGTMGLSHGEQGQNSKKRTHSEAWEDEEQVKEKPRTRRRLN